VGGRGIAKGEKKRRKKVKKPKRNKEEKINQKIKKKPTAPGVPKRVGNSFRKGNSSA
jgi:hypothetical protein